MESTSTGRQWPRRLLHVPSMTSLQRSEDGYYGSLHNPPYHAISYTWGRFTTKNGPALSVSGITWQIPSINTKHFTVSKFQDALKKAVAPNGLVWVDVACIDQEDSVVKMDEIGKQGNIFRLAQEVYIWLTEHEADRSAASLDALGHFADRLGHMKCVENSTEYDGIDSLEKILAEVESVTVYLGKFFNDPWFSSLWTLQEAYLCGHAILLAGSARTIMKSPQWGRLSTTPAAIKHVIDNCQEVKMHLLPYAEDDPNIRDLLAVIDRSGLSFGCPDDKSPSGLALSQEGAVLLYSAAHYRMTTNSLDRIYGIMQAYGFCLGASREPGRHFTLEELEDQLGEALNATSPMATQMHVHTVPQVLGSTWKPSQSSTLPAIYYMTSCLSTKCTISKESGHQPTYTGRMCSLPMLHEYWLQANARNEEIYDKSGLKWQHYAAYIHLDASQEGSHSPLYDVKQVELERQPSSSCPCKSCIKRPKEKKNGLEEFLADMPRKIMDYQVLLLGRALLTRWTGPSTTVDHYPTFPWLRTVSGCVGLLVVKERLSGEDVWRRVGISSWEANIHDELQVSWTPFRGYLA